MKKNLSPGNGKKEEPSLFEANESTDSSLMNGPKRKKSKPLGSWFPLFRNGEGGDFCESTARA